MPMPAFCFVTQETTEAGLEIAFACLRQTTIQLPPPEFCAYWVDELLTDGREDRTISLTYVVLPGPREVSISCRMWVDFVRGWVHANCQVVDRTRGDTWQFGCTNDTESGVHVSTIASPI